MTCPQGTYSTGGVGANCTACPSGTTTPGAGTTTLNCTVYICPPGQGLFNGPNGSGCFTCQSNTYSPGGNATNPTPRCQPCPSGTTSGSGATACTGEQNVSTACLFPGVLPSEFTNRTL